MNTLFGPTLRAHCPPVKGVNFHTPGPSLDKHTRCRRNPDEMPLTYTLTQSLYLYLCVCVYTVLRCHARSIVIYNVCVL